MIGLLKKHAFILACAGVAALAIVGAIPGCLKNRDNHERMEQKAKEYENIRSLLRGEAVGSDHLIVNSDAIREMKQYQEKVQREFVTTQKEARQINARQPLGLVQADGSRRPIEVFPLPKARDLPFVFQRAYQEAFEDLVRELHGRGPLEKDVLEELLEKIRDQEAARRPAVVMPAFEEEDRFTTERESVEETPALRQARVKQARLEYASTLGMYLSLESFDRGEWAYSPDRPTPEDMWMGQIDYWIQRDLVDVLKELNDKANVLGNPAKRLIAVRVDEFYLTAAGAKPRSGREKPTKQTEEELPAFDPAVSVTGRISNPLFDVVHFEFELVIDSRRINSLIRLLVEKNLYCVRSLSFQAVDHLTAQQSGYVYGPAPVVHLTVSAEAIFLRQAYADMMPPSVKEQLPGFEEPSAEVAAAAGP